MNGRRIPLAPAEGWLTVGLVLLLCLTMAWAIDDVALVLGEGAFTDFLVPMAMLGVLCSFIGVKVGWGRWLTYLVGALFAALIVPLVVGSMLPTKVDTLSAWFVATAASAAKALNDLVVQSNRLTNEYGHYMLVLGLFVWGTSMFASYATFGHRRPLNAIVIVGLVLLVNMSADVRRPARLPRPVQHRLAVPAGPLSRPRRAGRVAPSPDRRSRLHLGRLPARRDRVHRRRHRGIAAAHEHRPVGAARGELGPARRHFVELSRSISKFLPTGGATKAFGSDFDPMSTGIHGKWQPNTASSPRSSCRSTPRSSSTGAP